MRCIHSTADFEYEQLYYAQNQPMEHWHAYLAGGGTVVTDVTMVQAGITRAYREQHGVEVLCYLNDARVAELAEREGLTRSQAGMRLALAEHPRALFVVGNAPTALFELAEQVQAGRCQPAGIIAAPVGFVNVVEAKLKTKSLPGLPLVIIEGRKGGSSVAASIVNAAFTLQQAL